MNDSKDTLATNPVAIFVLDAAVIQDCSFIEVDAFGVNRFREGNFIGMKVLPTGLALDLMRTIPEDVFNAVRTELDPSIQAQVWWMLV